MQKPTTLAVVLATGALAGPAVALAARRAASATPDASARRQARRCSEHGPRSRAIRRRAGPRSGRRPNHHGGGGGELLRRAGGSGSGTVALRRTSPRSRGVLLGDRLALELHRRRQLVAAGQPVAREMRELLDLLDARELRVGGVDARLHRRAHPLVARQRLQRGVARCRAAPPTRARSPGRARSAPCCRAARRRSRTAWPISGLAPFSVDSMLAGDMFLPAALMMISFLRSTIRR